MMEVYRRYDGDIVINRCEGEFCQHVQGIHVDDTQAKILVQRLKELLENAEAETSNP